MASTARPWLDKVYLAYFLIHIPVMFFVDLVPLYPIALWSTPTAPLRILSDLRSYYVQTYNDPFFHPAPAPIPNFFVLFSLLELVFHLPVSVWAVRRLWTAGTKTKTKGDGLGKGLGGDAELLLLVYGVETALTTATCMYELWSWDPAALSLQEKTVLVGGLYGGYLAIAVVLTVDMYMRLLARVNAVDMRKKVQ
ncbi:transmembrane protein 6/97 [Xylariomycetidae sp. FL2044]|nr:transmembrane protein 6/97 [Xylariomycetidae sp. FL2044]